MTINRVKQLEIPLEELLLMDIKEDPEYPQLFSIIPLFQPTADRTKLDTTNWDDNSEYSYATTWGSVTRFGPGLNMYDEDTLIGLLQVARDKKITGEGRLLPIKLPNHEKKRSVVHVGETSAYHLNKFLGRSDSEKDLIATRQSVSRLSKTVLQLYSTNTDIEGDTKFFDYVGKRDFKGNFLIQFRPELVQLLEQYVRIDMTLRKSLSPLGKAVHKYICNHSNRLSIKLIDLAKIVGWTGRPTDLKNLLMGTKSKSSQMSLMFNHGFLESYELTGTGRKIPYTLNVVIK